MHGYLASDLGSIVMHSYSCLPYLICCHSAVSVMTVPRVFYDVSAVRYVWISRLKMNILITRINFSD